MYDPNDPSRMMFLWAGLACLIFAVFYCVAAVAYYRGIRDGKAQQRQNAHRAYRRGFEDGCRHGN